MTLDDQRPPAVTPPPLRGGFNSEVPTVTRWQLYERDPKPLAKPDAVPGWASNLRGRWHDVLYAWRAKPK